MESSVPETAKLAILIAGNFSADEENADPYSLLSYLPPELAACCKIIEWSSQPSSYYSIKLTLDMSNMFETLIEDGYSGIIVVAGSAVMDEMAYVTDLLWQHEQPVIYANLMVQGRAGLEEGLINMKCSVLAALSPDARGKGVLLCSSGELFAASEVRMVDPTSTDNAFESPEKGSLGKLLNGEIKFFRNIRRPEFLARRPESSAPVDIMWASLGGGERMISMLSSDHTMAGLVLAGFGTGNISPAWVPHVRNILRRRVPVAVVSRCMLGHVQESSTAEGSITKLFEMGVISGGTLTPYQARIRMSLGIGAGLSPQGLSLYLLNRQVSEDSPVLYK